MPPRAKAPLSEKGAPSWVGVGGGLLPYSAMIDDREYAPDLKWPQSIDRYTRMQTDAQIKGLLLTNSLPTRRRWWGLDRNGARPEVVEHIADSMRLPIRGEDPPTQRRRITFSWDRHIAHVLRAPAFGHNYFEKVYRYDEETKLLSLLKVATRPPRTIADFEVDQHGELKAIRQNVGGAGTGSAIGNFAMAAITGTVLERGRLVPYVWDADDDGDWTGRSILRACYRNWLVKDMLIRADATKHERNSMGIPWFEVDPAASKKQIEELAEVAMRMRAGEQSGGAGPGKLHLKGVEGILPDTILSIREHDHQMSRAFLAMFMELGTSETGSRALGGDFIDLHEHMTETVADWVQDRAQAELVEGLVEDNWGPDEQPPLLVHEKRDAAPSIEELSFAVKEGLIAVDPELSSYIVQRWKLPRGAGKAPEPPEPEPPPAAGPPEDPPEPTEPPTQTARARRTTLATPARAAELNLPANPRRQPYEQEVQAAVDFAGIETSYLAGQTSLVEDVKAAQAEQIDALVGAVAANAGDAPALAELEVDPIDSGIIAGHLHEALAEGVESASVEHAAQVEGMQAWRRPPKGTRAVQMANVNEDDELAEQANVRAEAEALILAAALAEAASRRGVAVSQMSADAAAQAVRAHLEGLSDAFLTERLGGSRWEAFNSGRSAYMSANGAREIYASELLDSNTCAPCMGIDGTQWDTVAQAQADAYPQGGYIFCSGGLRCRGTLVATY